MLIVYTVPPSLYCAKLRILLRHKQLSWEELPPPGGYGSEEYRRIVPSGNLPALVDGEFQLADSEAIAEYLNEKFPNPPMLPENLLARAAARELSRFHDTRLEPLLRTLFAHIVPAKRDAVFVATQSEQLNLRIAQLAHMLELRAQHNPLNANADDADGPTLADCGLPITFAWIDALEPVLELQMKWPDPVKTLRARQQQYRAVADELDNYLPALNQFIEHQVNSQI